MSIQFKTFLVIILTGLSFHFLTSQVAAIDLTISSSVLQVNLAENLTADIVYTLDTRNTANGKLIEVITIPLPLTSTGQVTVSLNNRALKHTLRVVGKQHLIELKFLPGIQYKPGQRRTIKITYQSKETAGSRLGLTSLIMQNSRISPTILYLNYPARLGEPSFRSITETNYTISKNGNHYNLITQIPAGRSWLGLWGQQQVGRVSGSKLIVNEAGPVNIKIPRNFNNQTIAYTKLNGALYGLVDIVGNEYAVFNSQVGEFTPDYSAEFAVDPQVKVLDPNNLRYGNRDFGNSNEGVSTEAGSGVAALQYYQEKVISNLEPIYGGDFNRNQITANWDARKGPASQYCAQLIAYMSNYPDIASRMVYGKLTLSQWPDLHNVVHTWCEFEIAGQVWVADPFILDYTGIDLMSNYRLGKLTLGYVSSRLNGSELAAIFDPSMVLSDLNQPLTKVTNAKPEFTFNSIYFPTQLAGVDIGYQAIIHHNSQRTVAVTGVQVDQNKIVTDRSDSALRLLLLPFTENKLAISGITEQNPIYSGDHVFNVRLVTEQGVLENRATVHFDADGRRAILYLLLLGIVFLIPWPIALWWFKNPGRSVNS